MNPGLPYLSPNRQSYPPLSRNRVADLLEPVGGAGRGPPHLDWRPITQENAAIKDLCLASGRGCVPSPTEVSEVQGDRGRMRPIGQQKCSPRRSGRSDKIHGEVAGGVEVALKSHAV